MNVMLLFLVFISFHTPLTAAAAQSETKDAGTQAQPQSAAPQPLQLVDYLARTYLKPLASAEKSADLELEIKSTARRTLRQSLSELLGMPVTDQRRLKINLTVQRLMFLRDYDFILKAIHAHKQPIDQLIVQEIFKAIINFVLPCTINFSTGQFKFEKIEENSTRHFKKTKELIELLIEKGLPLHTIQVIILVYSLLIDRLDEATIDNFQNLMFLGIAFTFDDKKSAHDATFLAQFSTIPTPITKALLNEARIARATLLQCLINQNFTHTILSLKASEIFTGTDYVKNSLSVAKHGCLQSNRICLNFCRGKATDATTIENKLQHQYPFWASSATEAEPTLQDYKNTIELFLIEEFNVPTDKVENPRPLEKIKKEKNRSKLQRSFKEMLSTSRLDMQLSDNYLKMRLIALRLMDKFHDYDFITETLRDYQDPVDQSVMQAIFQSFVDHITHYEIDIATNKSISRNDAPLKDLAWYKEIKKLACRFTDYQKFSHIFLRSFMLQRSLESLSMVPHVTSHCKNFMFLIFSYLWNDRGANKIDKALLSYFRGRKNPIPQKLLNQDREHRNALFYDFINGVRNKKQIWQILTILKEDIPTFKIPHIRRKSAADNKKKRSLSRQQNDEKEDVTTDEESDDTSLPLTIRMLMHSLNTHLKRPVNNPERPDKLARLAKKSTGSLRSRFFSALKYRAIDLHTADTFCKVQLIALALMKQGDYDCIFNTIKHCSRRIDQGVLHALALSLYYHVTGQTIDPSSNKPIHEDNTEPIDIKHFKIINDLMKLLIKKGASAEFVQTLFVSSSLITSLDDYQDENITRNLVFLGLAHRYDSQADDADSLIAALHKETLEERETLLNEILFKDQSHAHIQENLTEIIKAGMFSERYLTDVYKKFNDENKNHEDDLSALFTKLTIDERENAQQDELVRTEAQTQTAERERERVRQRALARNERQSHRAFAALKKQADEQENKLQQAQEQATHAAAAAQKIATKRASRGERKRAKQDAEVAAAAQQLESITLEAKVLDPIEDMPQEAVSASPAHAYAHEQSDDDEKEELNTAEHLDMHMADQDADYQNIVNKFFGMALLADKSRLFKLLETFGPYQGPSAQDDLLRIINMPLLDDGSRVMHIVLMYGNIEFAIHIAHNFPQLDFFIKNDEGESAADIFLGLLQKNNKIFFDFPLAINSSMRIPVAELVEILQTEWLSNGVTSEIFAAIELIHKFARRIVNVQPKSNKQAYSIYEILKEFMKP